MRKQIGWSLGPLSLAQALLVTALVTGGAEARTSRTVKIGDTVTFELAGNPSTGYRWNLKEPKSTGLDAVRVKAVGYKSTASGGRVVVGAPAPFLFQITCVKAGSAQLFFEYVGPTGTVSNKMHEIWVRCD